MRLESAGVLFFFNLTKAGPLVEPYGLAQGQRVGMVAPFSPDLEIPPTTDPAAEYTTTEVTGHTAPATE